MLRRTWRLICIASAVGGCSSPSASIIGEWSLVAPRSGDIVELYFDSDGSCGRVVTFQEQRVCQGTCTYTYANQDLTIVTTVTGFPPSTAVSTASISGDTLTLAYGADAGGVEQYTREDSDHSHTCP